MIEDRILALAYTPANRTQITDWAPFGGNTLAEIVNEHNKMQKQRWEGYPPSDIEQFMEIIDVVRHDLNAIDKLVPKDYDSILVLLADRNIDIAQQKPNELNWIRDGLSKSQTRGKFYLTQAGQKQDPQRLVDFFRGRVQPYPTKAPHLLNSQSDFEYFLRFLHVPPDPPPTAGSNLIDELFPPQSAAGRGELRPEQKRQEYLSARAKIQAEVREAAIEQDLPEDQIRAVARLATQQELAFREVIRNTGKSLAENVILDALRTPAPKLALEPFQKPNYYDFELLEFRPAGSFENLPFQDREILHQLGVQHQNDSVIQINTPETQNLLKQLGSNVRVNVISANLPTFKTEF